MVSLNLVPKPAGSGEDARRRREWLDSIGALLGRVLGAEARMWLITTVSSLDVGEWDIHFQDCFLDLLRNSMRESSQRRGDRAHGPVELQFARMLFEQRPRCARRLIKYDVSMFERLFSGHSKRILFFFDRFAGVSQPEHLLGARALANFAFRNRDLCWHHLAWEGTHAHSPATVAAKPHYFMELDVVNTVLNFFEDVPEFWRSKEFRDSLKSDDFWNTDKAFFAEYLAGILARELFSDTDDAHKIRRIVREFLREVQFSVLCQHLLHLASDEALLKFINDLGTEISDLITDSRTRVETARKTNWMEVMVYAAVQWENLIEPILCNACINNGRRLLRILLEEEYEEHANALKRLMSEGSGVDEGQEHWALRDEIAKMDKPAACRYLALEAWVLFYQLSSETAGADLYEALLGESGIIQHRQYSSSQAQVNATDKKRSKSSNKRSRKKRHRRRDNSDTEGSDDELPGLTKEELGWRLSIDMFKSTWTKADLPEELAGIAVRSWLDWLIKKWL